MRYVTRHNVRSIARTVAVKLSNHGKKVPSIVHRDSSFVSIVNSVRDFSATFKKEHGVSYFAARMVEIVAYMVLSDFLSRNKL